MSQEQNGTGPVEQPNNPTEDAKDDNDALEDSSRPEEANGIGSRREVSGGGSADQSTRSIMTSSADQEDAKRQSEESSGNEFSGDQPSISYESDLPSPEVDRGEADNCRQR